MVSSDFDSTAEPRASVANRIVSGLAGSVALIIGTVVTLGGALIGVVAIVVGWIVMRHRQRQLTRFGAWLASAGATSIALAIIVGMSALLLPDGPEQTPEQRAQAQARARDSMPAWLKTISPGNSPQNAVADSLAQKLVQNKPVMVWASAMATIIGSSFLGAISGTIAWGAMMLLYRSYKGEWMPPSKEEPVIARAG